MDKRVTSKSEKFTRNRVGAKKIKEASRREARRFIRLTKRK